MEGNRKVSVSKLSGEEVSAALSGEIVEVTRQGKTEAVLIRPPRNQEEWERLAQLVIEFTRKK